MQGRELRTCESRRLVETERFTVYYLRGKIASEKVNSLQPVFDDQTDAWRPHVISCPKVQKRMPQTHSLLFATTDDMHKICLLSELRKEQARVRKSPAIDYVKRTGGKWDKNTNTYIVLLFPSLSSQFSTEGFFQCQKLSYSTLSSALVFSEGGRERES